MNRDNDRISYHGIRFIEELWYLNGKIESAIDRFKHGNWFTAHDREEIQREGAHYGWWMAETVPEVDIPEPEVYEKGAEPSW